MFVSKAGHHELCQHFFFPAWASHSLLPFDCVCCFMEGLDAVQIPVASRDRLSSPPVACHPIHKQITPAGTSELLLKNNKQNSICI